MYNKTWDRSYGTNYGQYRGSDRYTVSESYSYSKTYEQFFVSSLKHIGVFGFSPSIAFI